MQKESNKKTKSIMKMAAEAAQELLDYCNEIVDFARIDYGVRSVFNQPIDLHELLLSVQQLLSVQP